MRFCRVEHEGQVRFARIEGEWLVLLDGAPWAAGASGSGPPLPLAGARLAVPVAPQKVIGVGQNYRQHALEMGKPVPEEPVLFLKPPSALNGPGAPILLPPQSSEVHHEAELALVVGRRLRGASEAEAEEGIFGVTCFNDVTARDIQRRELQHTRAKGFDTFACAGPWISAGLDFSDLRVRCLLDGEMRQDGRTSDMVFSPARLLSFISRVMTLEPGDLITTGTPSGVGPLRRGQVVEVEIEGIGTLRNPVESARD